VAAVLYRRYRRRVCVLGAFFYLKFVAWPIIAKLSPAIVRRALSRVVNVTRMQ